MKTKKTRYAHYNINYHFVWIPKYRRKILVGPIAEELERLIRKVCSEREVRYLVSPFSPIMRTSLFQLLQDMLPLSSSTPLKGILPATCARSFRS